MVARQREKINIDNEKGEYEQNDELGKNNSTIMVTLERN